ncbi:hypothetical protein EDD98_5599 [Streptomyces sp. PanSC19]|nr:hypothetical protein EDD98_5599 [Streptomyces sp. PanSC19]
MKANDTSWLITTEVILEPEEHDPSELPPCTARFVTIPGTEELRYSFREQESGDYELLWDGLPLPFEHLVVEADDSDMEKITYRYLSDIFQRAGYDQRKAGKLVREVLVALQEVPLPVSGSLPTKFQVFSSLLAGSPGSVVGVTNALGPHPSLFVILGSTGMSLALMVIVPALRGVGGGLEHGLRYRVSLALGVPPHLIDKAENPPAPDKTPPPSS